MHPSRHRAISDKLFGLVYLGSTLQPAILSISSVLLYSQTWFQPDVIRTLLGTPVYVGYKAYNLSR